MDYPRYLEFTLGKQRGLNLVASRRCRNVDRSMLRRDRNNGFLFLCVPSSRHNFSLARRLQ